ncbi:MAG: metallophosphoesterase [Saprospiraceae bacterium]|nr:metallophosphoesterase [Saprospiraceae bacterium]
MVGKISKISFVVFSYILVNGSRGALLGGSLFVLWSCVPDASERAVVPQDWLWDTCHVSRLHVAKAPEVDSTWEHTQLPHRIMLPNQAIWYVAKVHPSLENYLHVDADDGAQVFLDGSQFTAINGYYYDLPSTSDTAVLAIRVLNNAVKGGLKKVNWIRKDSIDLIWNEQNDVLEQLEELYLSNLYQSDVFLPEEDFQVHDHASTKFTVWGDSQGGWAKFQALCNSMLYVPGLEFSIGLGDLTSDGVSMAQWFSFLTCLAPLIEKRVLVFPVAGNHDYDGYYDDLVPENYIRHIIRANRPTYTNWTAGPAAFIALDPNGSFPLGIDKKQYDWAIEKMQSEFWQKAKWRFILLHQPPYAQGWPGYEGDQFIRTFIEDNAENYRIDFVLSGHCHDFEYLVKQYGTQRTNFLISGGGGGSLEPDENDNRINMDTIINIHHYLLFELDEKSAQVKMYDELNHLIWRNQFPPQKP